jgi:hypothetical protein
MTTDTPKLLRDLAAKIEADSGVGAVVCTMAAHEIEDLNRRLSSEIDARNNCLTALREKDNAMGVLFDRLHNAGVDTSDLIP